MKRNQTKTILLALVIGIFVASMFALAGCAGGSKGGGTLSSEILEETNAFKVTADNADGKSGVKVDGAIVLKESDVLVVSPDLQKGKLQVKLLDKSDNAVFDKEVSGQVLDSYEVAAGEYAISVDCLEGGTTGTLLVVAVDAEEFEQQNQDLEKALETVGASEAAKKLD